MKKNKILIIFLVVILLLSGCAAEKEEQTAVLTEYSGTCSIVMAKEGGFYYPTISGTLALSFRPNKVIFKCAGEEFELDIKTVNHVNDLYVLGFKQVHIFGHLLKQEYVIALDVIYNGKKLTINEFATFDCDDEYFSLGGVNLSTGEKISAMDRESNWTPPY